MTNATTTILPAEIQKLIAKVVKRTRLRKAERADIERELTAHFRDGLASGKSVAQLVDAFGEAKVSAKSIRAGAIAKRSLLDRSIRNTAIVFNWLCLVLGVIYVSSAVYLWMHAPVISFDPIKWIHAHLPKVSEQDRAWPTYKQGLIALADPIVPTAQAAGRTDPLPQYKLTFKSLGESQGDAIPEDPKWEAQCKAMRARRDGLDTLVSAAFKPSLGYMPSAEPQSEDADIFNDPPAGEEDPGLGLFMYSLRLQHLSILQQASRLLGADSLMAIEDGDGDRFVRNIDAIIRLSHHVEEARFLISQIVGTAIRNLAFQRIIMAVEWRPDSLSDDQLNRLAGLLRDISQKDYEVNLRMEELGIQDFLQRTYSDDGTGNGWFNPGYGYTVVQKMVGGLPHRQVTDNLKSLHSFVGSLGAPVGAAILASRKETLALHAMLMRNTEEQSKRQIWEQNFSYETECLQQMEVNEMAKAKWLFVRLLVPAVSHAATLRRIGESQCFAAQTAIALTQYRRTHGGSWPATMEELVPAYLDAVPPDPWSGAPINYQVKDGRAYVWSMVGDAKAPNKIDELSFPGWVNTSPSNRHAGMYWLWFLGDDKLERWQLLTTN